MVELGIAMADPHRPPRQAASVEALLAAVEREADAIVASAVDDPGLNLRKAQDDLEVLAVQLRAALAYAHAAEAPHAAGALEQARRALSAIDAYRERTHPTPRVGLRLLVPRLPSAAGLAATLLAAVLVGGILFGAWFLLQRPLGELRRAGADTGGRTATGTTGRATPAAAAVPPARTPPAPSGALAPFTSDDLLPAAERWLEAYYVQDQQRLAALSRGRPTVSDERAESERLPAGLANVRRTVEEAKVHVYGTTAILTARVTERAGTGAPGAGPEAVAFVSQMWTQRAGGWELDEVRIVSAAAVSRAFRH